MRLIARTRWGGRQDIDDCKKSLNQPEQERLQSLALAQAEHLSDKTDTTSNGQSVSQKPPSPKHRLRRQFKAQLCSRLTSTQLFDVTTVRCVHRTMRPLYEVKHPYNDQIRHQTPALHRTHLTSVTFLGEKPPPSRSLHTPFAGALTVIPVPSVIDRATIPVSSIPGLACCEDIVRSTAGA